MLEPRKFDLKIFQAPSGADVRTLQKKT